jgi:hypothetical protein
MKTNTITQCFKEILEGDKEQSRSAARRVRKLVYGRDDKSKYTDIKHQIQKAPKEYAKIKEDWRQENFVTAVSVIYFLHDREADPDFLFPWLFELLQHERGAIRYAAVRMLGNEIGPLTVHIRHPELKLDKNHVTPQKADAILSSLYLSLIQLLSGYEKPQYRRHKYISSLPSSPYKSVQLVLGRMEEDCGKGYLEQLAQKWQQQPVARSVPRKQEVKKKQDELELQIAQLLEAANSEWTVDDVKEVIYAERDHDNFTELLAMFDTGEGVAQLPDIIEVLTDAWNYFPHHALGSQAPVEVTVADFTMDKSDNLE